jgi:anti-sigma B factor antagonist
MKIDIKKIEKINILFPPEKLDMSIHAQFDDYMMKLIKKERDKHLLLNFSRVKHLNSMYLSTFVKIMKTLNSSKRLIKFCCVPEGVKKVFSVADLLKIFDIYEEEEEALNSFNNSRVA